MPRVVDKAARKHHPAVATVSRSLIPSTSVATLVALGNAFVGITVLSKLAGSSSDIDANPWDSALAATLLS